MNPGLTAEAGKTARSVVEVMKESPLSLALVVMNFALVGFLFYSGSTTLDQRSAMSKMIIDWQRETGTILGGCVSQDVTKMMLDNMHRITETMLSAEQREIARMQQVIKEERDRNTMLQIEMLKQGIRPLDDAAPKPQGDKYILFRMPE
jgi:hypothetical protein